ncbi:phage tail tape measure protein [Rhizobium skierniewicense]|uniref:phage tail tape measure protein n=1 Tax=Rhizobium skierniewicense TaxID=984260 RepID=UPI001574328F|nr:phage tail tape measure protein [Rhizobium skierniewicense]NTF32302.1 phage tail tape measure protein [Rhizobium skierniewicense]
MANRKIKAELEIDGKDSTSPAFRSVAARMGQMERQMGRFNKTAADFDRKVASINRHSAGLHRAAEGFNRAGTILRTGLAGYGALEVGRAIIGTVKDFAALERQMNRIGITAEATGEQTKKAFEQAQQVSKDLGYDSVQPAIEAIDTLVASGKSLEEAMAFLPSVLATAQATGSATQDIANTGLKATDALKIETKNLQRAFDIMVTGGKAGQFELKDMAQYIPGLANSFATLGYTGEDGLKKLVAILQTIREDTGDASSAATQAQNVFGKMYSEETGKKFAKFGIDLRKEMEAATKSGEDAVSAFVRLSQEAVKGDLSKLPLLFSDQEFRLGMQSLMTSGDSLKRFIDTMNSAQVNGTVFKDVNRVLSDTQASIDGMAISWEKLRTSLGESVAPVAKPVMDGAVNQLDRYNARQRGMEKRGWGWARRNLSAISEQEELDLAYEGGYRDEKFVGEYWASRYGAGKDDPRSPKASTGRQGRPVVIGDFPGGGKGYTNKTLPPSEAPVPLPKPREMPAKSSPLSDLQRQYQEYGRGRQAGQAITTDVANMDKFRGIRDRLDTQEVVATGGRSNGSLDIPSATELKNALKIDIDSLKNSGSEAGQKVADGGREAGKAIEDSTAFLKVAGVDVGAALSAAIRSAFSSGADEAVNKLSNVRIPAPVVANVGGAKGGPRVNADTGRTFAPAVSRPGGSE